MLFQKVQVLHSNGAKDRTQNILLYNHTGLPGIRFSRHKKEIRNLQGIEYASFDLYFNTKH